MVLFCSLSVFSRDFVAANGGEGILYAPQDTVKHTVFHSKFGDDVKFPALTGNAEENAVTLRNFFNVIWQRTNNRMETFIALIPLIPKGGDESTIETLNMMMPMSYRCFYSASMEYLLFRDMGGRNRAVQQIFSALRNEMSSRFTPLCHKNPELYCAQLDSVMAFVEKLDYIGDIYPEIQNFKSREEQPGIVRKLGEAIELIKANMRKNAEKDRIFRELVAQLYVDPEQVDLHKYFTDKVCQKLESNELNLKYLSPEKEWTDWDVNDTELCSFSFDAQETFLVILSNKKLGDMLDSDNSRSLHSYYVTYINQDGKWLIDDIKVQNTYR